MLHNVKRKTKDASWFVYVLNTYAGFPWGIGTLILCDDPPLIAAFQKIYIFCQYTK